MKAIDEDNCEAVVAKVAVKRFGGILFQKNVS
jgi:hypothetical protein